mgnify:FL=1
MESRMANIIFNKAGGNAGADSKGCKLSLPSSWVKQLGISELDREVGIDFDGEKIIVSKRAAIGEFIETKLHKGHHVALLDFFDGSALCTRIAADFTDKTIAAENADCPLIKTAFGKKPFPDWDDFNEFLESRCVPRGRAGLREYLEALGLDEYDPLEIIKITHGRMAEDDQWINIEVKQ